MNNVYLVLSGLGNDVIKIFLFQALKLVEHFLVPALDNGMYGPLLEWEDEQKATFRIRWTHKARSTWEKSELRVFLVS